MKRMGPGAGARAGVVGAVIVGGATLVYHSIIDKMNKLRQRTLHMYQDGNATEDQYRRVFGNDSHPELIRKYWEM